MLASHYINIPHSGTGDGGIGDYLHGIAWGNCFVYAYGDDDGGEDDGGAKNEELLISLIS